MFIIVGVFIVTGLDKKTQVAVEAAVPALTRIENKILPAPGADAGPLSELGPGASADTPGPFNANFAAPELTGIQQWINSEPTRLSELRGKVVLIDFWTYSCVNCQRTQPYLNSWYETYHEQGLEVIGVHAPEFAFEKDPTNVEKAVRDAGIHYRVALDNDFATWQAYHNRYWPAKYLIDAAGNVRYVHFGEGAYGETEEAIRELLGSHGDAAAPASPTMDKPMARTYDTTAETYLGINRFEKFQGSPQLHLGSDTYRAAPQLAQDAWTLTGGWKASGEAITATPSTSGTSALDLRFRGRQVNLVLDGPRGTQVSVSIRDRDGTPIASTNVVDVREGMLHLDGARMYQLLDSDVPFDGATVHLEFPAGVSAHAFTFG